MFKRYTKKPGGKTWALQVRISQKWMTEYTYATPPPYSTKRFRTRNKTQIVKILNFLGLPKSNYSLTA